MWHRTRTRAGCKGGDRWDKAAVFRNSPAQVQHSVVVEPCLERLLSLWLLGDAVHCAPNSARATTTTLPNVELIDEFLRLPFGQFWGNDGSGWPGTALLNRIWGLNGSVKPGTVWQQGFQTARSMPRGAHLCITSTFCT